MCKEYLNIQLQFHNTCLGAFVPIYVQNLWTYQCYMENEMSNNAIFLSPQSNSNRNSIERANRTVTYVTGFYFHLGRCLKIFRNTQRCLLHSVQELCNRLFPIILPDHVPRLQFIIFNKIAYRIYKFLQKKRTQLCM